MAVLETDQELLKRAQAGDIAAAQCLLLRYDDAIKQHVDAVLGEAKIDAGEVVRRIVHRMGKDLSSSRLDSNRDFRDELLSVAGDQCARALVTAAQTGDAEAVERLFLMYEDEAKAYLKARLVPKEHQEDDDPADKMHIHATWHEVRQRAEPKLTGFEYRQRHAFAAFLTTIARNLCNDKQKNSHRGDYTPLEKLSIWVSDGSPSPSSVAARVDRADALHDALTALNDEQKTAVERMLDGKTTAEIALELNKTPGAIRMILKRAKERLHEELGSTSLWFSKK